MKWLVTFLALLSNFDTLISAQGSDTQISAQISGTYLIAGGISPSPTVTVSSAATVSQTPTLSQNATVSTTSVIIYGGTTIAIQSTIQTVTAPDGETIILGPNVVVIGSDTISVPQVTAATTLTSDNVTLTLQPGGLLPTTSSQTSTIVVLDGQNFTIGRGSQTITEPNGNTVVIGSNNVVVQNGNTTNTLSIPPPGVTLTTDGIVIGILVSIPSPTPTVVVIDGQSYTVGTISQTITEDDGNTIVVGPSNVVVQNGNTTSTLNFPPPGTTLITGGIAIGLASQTPITEVFDEQTFTLETGFQTITEPGGETVIIGPSDIVIQNGTVNETLAIPPPGVTESTDSIVFLIPAVPTSPILDTITLASLTEVLTIYSVFPNVTVVNNNKPPITTGTATTGTFVLVTTSSGSEGTPVVVNIPEFPCLLCGCWFCPPIIAAFDFFGFIGPGIYPPPIFPPPGFSSNMPSITIGVDGNPTWPIPPPEIPESTCSSQTASDCTELISYGLNTQGSTTASTTDTQCVTTVGCLATGTTTTTATTSSCTVFDTCSVTTSCPNLFERVVKRAGCSTGISCSQTSLNCPQQTNPYIIFPADQASVPEILELFTDEFKIDSSLIAAASSISYGVNYWQVPLNATQVGNLEYNPLIGTLYPACTDACIDPTEESVTDNQEFMDSITNDNGKNPVIDHRNPSSNSTESTFNSKLGKRNEGPVRQPSANDDLLHISQSYLQTLADLNGNYLYDGSAGVGSMVYVIDTGANLNNPEFTNNRNKLPAFRWIFAGVNPNRIMEDSEVVPSYDTLKRPYYSLVGHGTAMLSKVCGFSLGVAKRASATVVKCEAKVRPECLLDALTKVLDDVEEEGYTNVVVSMSLFWEITVLQTQLTPAGATLWINRMIDVMDDLANRGVILVTGSGNDMAITINGYPALFANQGIPSLIVAGATDYRGVKYSSTNTDPNLPLIWAPGEMVEVAAGSYLLPISYFANDRPSLGFFSRSSSGTSISAAMIAGLCAYFLSLTNMGTVSMDELIRPSQFPIYNAMAMKTYLMESSYMRSPPANQRTVYNGIQVEYGDDPPDSCLISPWKRQVGGEPDQSCCSCQSTGSTPSLSQIPTTTTTTTILVTPTPPPITVTIPEPSTSAQCFQVGFANPSITLEVSLPSDVPSLFIYVPLADQQGEWTIDLGGPSSEEETVVGTQVTTNQSSIPFNNTQVGSPFSWVSQAGTTGTVVEYLFQPNQGNLTYEITLFGTYPCTPPVICEAPQACNLNSCNGTFNTDGTAQCGDGCTCIPVIPETCGPPADCNLFQCGGTFNTNGTAQCRNHFYGCPCIPVVPDICGPPELCNLNQCNGTFNTDGTSHCTGNFDGCTCIPVVPDTCGQPELCNLYQCNGVFNTDGTSHCTYHFDGCACIPVVPDTCGNPELCNLYQCNGAFNTDGTAHCTDHFDGCTCIPVIPDTCGPMADCNLYGCAGAFATYQNTAYCTGNFAGCQCNPVYPDTCGNQQLCSNYGCNGVFDANGDAAYCSGAYVGCQCIPTGTTCPELLCTSEGCDGSLDSDGYATCKGKYKTCLCILPGNPTPTTSAPGGCNTIPGCAGGPGGTGNGPTLYWGTEKGTIGQYNIMWESGVEPCDYAAMINNIGQNPCKNACVKPIENDNDCYQLGGCGGSSLWLLLNGEFYAGCQANSNAGPWVCGDIEGASSQILQVWECAP